MSDKNITAKFIIWQDAVHNAKEACKVTCRVNMNKYNLTYASVAYMRCLASANVAVAKRDLAHAKYILACAVYTRNITHTDNSDEILAINRIVRDAELDVAMHRAAVYNAESNPHFMRIRRHQCRGHFLML